MKNNIFKIITIIGGILVLAIPSIALAIDWDKYGGLSTTSLNPFQAEGAAEIIISVINVILTLLALFAVVLLIYAGFSYMFSRGDTEKVNKAKNIILTTVIGLIIIIAAYAISNYVFYVFNAATGGDKVGSSGGTGDAPECGLAGGQCATVSGEDDGSYTCFDYGDDNHSQKGWNNIGHLDCPTGYCCAPPECYDIGGNCRYECKPHEEDNGDVGCSNSHDGDDTDCCLPK